MKDVSQSKYLVNVDPTAAGWFTPANGGSAAILTLGMAGISITIKPESGTVNGQFKLQTTDFGPDTRNPPVTADWCDYANAQPSAAGAVSASIQWQLTDLRSKWLRVVFTDNSSSSPRVSVAWTGRALTGDT